MIGEPDFNFEIADVDAYKAAVYDKDGRRIWEYDKVRAISIETTKDDNFLIAYLPSELTSWKGGARIVSRKKETIFDYQLDDEVMDAIELPSGNILLTENKAGNLLEITRTGKIIRSIRLKAAVVFEITPSGEIIWQLRDSMRIKGITGVEILKEKNP